MISKYLNKNDNQNYIKIFLRILIVKITLINAFIHEKC